MILRLLFIGILGSCGYRVGDFRTPEKTLRVFVPVLENRTTRPIDLNEITSVFKENLESIRGVIVVNGRDEADVVLLGSVVQYDRGWGPTAYKGTQSTEAAGGLKRDALSASTARIHLGITLEKRGADGALLWSSNFVETELYELNNRLTLSEASAAMPQLHASRESLLLKKLTERIFLRSRAQIVDDF